MGIIDYPTQHEYATGNITESLVDDNERELIIKTTLLNYDIPHEFSTKAMQQVDAYQEPTAKDYQDRKDRWSCH